MLAGCVRAWGRRRSLIYDLLKVCVEEMYVCRGVCVGEG